MSTISVALLVTVNTNYDSDPDPGTCGNSNQRLNCSFRSAVVFCVSSFASISNCQIILPSGLLQLCNSSSQSGIELEILSNKSLNLAIHGINSAFYCAQGHNSSIQRFLSAKFDRKYGGSLALTISNIIVRGFGEIGTTNEVNGGAIRLEGLDGITLRGLSFLDNYGNDGGALYVTDSSKISIDNCGLLNNTAVGYGGALAIVSSSSILLTGVSLHANAAHGNGGAISLDHVTSFSIIN